MAASESQPLLLLDTASLYYRAFFGIPDRFTDAAGTPVNAVRGLLDMIAKLTTITSPRAVVAAWDENWRPEWRVALVPSYKSHRVAVPAAAAGGEDIEETPDRLEVQIPLIEEALALLNIPRIGADDMEADDVIASLAAQQPGPIVVVTGDRDLFQLVDDTRGVTVLYTGRGMNNLEHLDNHAVREKYGVSAAQYADFATLRGDASDGLPGVAGIGEKSAAKLLAEYGSLDAIASAAETGEIKGATGSKIVAAADYIPRAAEVVRVRRDLLLDHAPQRREALTEKEIAAATSFGEEHNVAAAMQRALTALAGDDL